VETTKQKGRPLNDIAKAYQKPLGHPLVAGTCLHDKHLRLKLPAKKK
jgi:hypothetical protein